MKNLRKPEEIIIEGVSLKQLIESHLKWLDDEETGKQLILEGADLRYANLIGVNLIGANLRRTDLKNADLENSDLYNANLENADLENVELENEDLRYAKLRYADLRYADLRYTNLENAKFYLTNLYKVKRDDLFGVSHIGSRDDTTHYFIEDNRVICGCFDNTLEKFINKVKDTYDKSSREYMEYMIAIDTFKRYKEMYYKIKES